MLQGLIDRLPDEIGPSTFDVLTTYPREDRATAPPNHVRIVSAKPAELLLIMLPLALLAYLLRLLHVPTRIVCRTSATRALLEADIVLDLAGISFSDGRGIPTLAYNVLMTGIPMLLGKRLVKCSQALGPFRTRANRAAAKLVLSRVDAICARGSRTAANLAELGVSGVTEAADLAFLMNVPQAAARRAALLAAPLGGNYIAAAPSAVARRYCESAGIDYVAVWSDVVGLLIDRGERVVLLAHSIRPSARESRMNDGPVCRAIYTRAGSPAACLLLDRSEPPTVLRAIIGGASVLVTSRFHAMISALATATPVVVAGWSHKYLEVMNEFGLGEFVVSYQALSAAGLISMLDDARTRSAAVRESIRRALPAEIDSARHNFQAIRSVLARPQR